MNETLFTAKMAVRAGAISVVWFAELQLLDEVLGRAKLQFFNAG